MAKKNGNGTRVLVLGGTGFLGGKVVKMLEETNKYCVYHCSRRTGIDARKLGELNDYVRHIKPVIVINCAAHVGGIAYNESKPIEVFEDNVAMGMNIVKAAAENGVKSFLNIISNCAYPGHLEIYEEKNFWNGAIHDSVMTYALPKKLVWGACFAYSKQYPMKSAHLILPNMYGCGDYFDPVRSHALGALIRKIVDAKKNNYPYLEIWGTGKPIREWLYVEDSVIAIQLALENFDKFIPNDFVNIGSGKGISIKDMATLIASIVKWKGEFIFNTKYQDGAMCKIFNVDKMRKLFNWEPPTKFKDGVEKTIAWYKENHG